MGLESHIGNGDGILGTWTLTLTKSQGCREAIQVTGSRLTPISLCEARETVARLEWVQTRMAS